ncbi:Uncharacterised protein [Yersinia frederiksenii]|nr:Uncharacterised protein [Yersinia frederiksenii]
MHLSYVFRLLMSATLFDFNVNGITLLVGKKRTILLLGRVALTPILSRYEDDICLLFAAGSGQGGDL